MPFLRRREVLAGIGLWSGAPLLGAFCRVSGCPSASSVMFRITRVMVLSYGGGDHEWLGDPGIGSHGTKHCSIAGYTPKFSYSELHKRFNNWHGKNLATIRERLGAARDGDGTMADRTLIANFNGNGLWHHGGAPFGHQYAWFIGSAGGYFKTNQYKKLAPMTVSMSDVFVSMANAMGVPITRFGGSMPDKSFLSGNPVYPAGPACKGPVPGLTA